MSFTKVYRCPYCHVEVSYEGAPCTTVGCPNSIASKVSGLSDETSSSTSTSEDTTESS